MDTDLEQIALFAIAVVVVLWPMLRRFRAKPTSRALPENAIVVDGSNVMHWGGEPSAKVLSRVLRNLEDKGYTPIVFFDASAGYRLADSYHNEAKLAALIGIPARHICVVDKGVVADQSILSFATDYNLRVVTNDQFRDWRVRFPIAGQKGTLLRGKWRDGSVVWRGQLLGQVFWRQVVGFAEPAVQGDGRDIKFEKHEIGEVIVELRLGDLCQPRCFVGRLVDLYGRRGNGHARMGQRIALGARLAHQGGASRIILQGFGMGREGREQTEQGAV